MHVACMRYRREKTDKLYQITLVKTPLSACALDFVANISAMLKP